jgi:hypothetical protein
MTAMRHYDVFNGDADGICALHQLRLADPIDSVLITGMKRDIALLGRVPAVDGDVVTVLDLSLDRNREALGALLERGVVVQYFDHHYIGEMPRHPALTAIIDPAGRTCTSALVDRHLLGRYRAWAVVGAFGDGMDDVAMALAAPLGLDEPRIEQLRELGQDLNYAAYGESPRDALVQPLALYGLVSRYGDPFELVAREPIFATLGTQRLADMEQAFATRDVHVTPRTNVWFLEDAPWARRVIGSFANRLALLQPHRAHAVLVPLESGERVVSVRAPRADPRAAVDLCRRFPTGGGRTSAAGIDRLDSAHVAAFVQAFDAYWHAPQPAAA